MSFTETAYCGWSLLVCTKNCGLFGIKGTASVSFVKVDSVTCFT